MKEYINLRKSKGGRKSFLVSRGSYATSWNWKYINLSYLQKVAPGNLQLFLKLVMAFRSEAVLSVDEMKLHNTNGDFSALEKTAHAMKPNGVYIGVDNLTSLVSSLEQVACSGNQLRVNTLITEIETLVHDVNKEIDEFLQSR